MDLPEKLLKQYPSAGRSHIQERKPKARLAPMYRTYPIMLIFDDGEAIDAEVTMPNKPYWGGGIGKRDTRHVEWRRCA